MNNGSFSRTAMRIKKVNVYPKGQFGGDRM